MAVRMITRSIKTTEVIGLFVDVSAKTTFEERFTLSCPCRSEQEIMKVVTKTGMFADTNKKLVAVSSFDICTTKFAMSEQTFIDHATQIEK